MGWLLDVTSYSARRYCVASSPQFQYSAMAAELMTGVAYVVISVMLFFIQRRRPKLIPSKSGWMFFAAVFLCCGVGHLMDVVVWERPVYNLWLVSRWMTGIISLMTVMALPAIYQQITHYRSGAEYHEMANIAHQDRLKILALQQRTERNNELLRKELDIMWTRIEHLRYKEKIGTEVESLHLQLQRIRSVGENR